MKKGFRFRRVTMVWMACVSIWFPLFSVFCCSCNADESLSSGIVMDGTIGLSAPLTLTGPDYVIKDSYGQKVQNNLFHSFKTFNLQSGESALFEGPPDVQRIIGRVTGGERSWIDGRLSSNIEGADLYLINPKGIVFGENAVLDLKGSFYAGSADYLQLGDSDLFYAEPLAGELLSAAAPTAFGFLGQAPAPLTLEGSYLEVPDGDTLALIGGDIALDDAVLKATDGQVSLSSVASPGVVGLQENSVDTIYNASLGDITLQNDSHLYTSGAAKGEIFIHANQFYLDQSMVRAETLSAGDDVADKPQISMELSGECRITNEGYISTVTDNSGNAGDIAIQAKSIEVAGGSQLDSSTYGAGQGGNITLTATDDIAITGSSDNYVSSVKTNVSGSGPGGDLTLTASTVTVDQEAEISTITGSETASGQITLNTQKTTVSDNGYIYTASLGPGNAGDIHITANEAFTMTSGKLFSSTTAGVGDTGKITISASQLRLTDASDLYTYTMSDGRAGDISISGDSLLLNAGSRIYSSTEAAGDAGKIQVQTDTSIDLKGTSPSGTASAIASNAYAGTGNAGDVSIETATLAMDQSAKIMALAFDEGHAGDIQLTADDIAIKNGAQVFANTYGAGDAGDIRVTIANTLGISGSDDNFYSGIYADTKNGTGDGGNITLTAKAVTLDQDGIIQATTSGEGNAQDIRLNVNTLQITQGAEIQTSSRGAGHAGNIEIAASGDVSLIGESDRTQSGLHADTEADGQGGNISVTAHNLTVGQNAEIKAEVKGNGQGGDIALNADALWVSNGGQIYASSVNRGDAGTIGITAASTVTVDGKGENYSNIQADTKAADGGTGGDITITTPRLNVQNDGHIETRTYGQGLGGNIQLDVDQLTIQGTGQILSSTSADGDAGTIAVTASESILISGAQADNPDYRSGIYASTFGSGGGGIIQVKTPELDIDQGLIQAVSTATGNSKRVSVDVGTLSLTHGGVISSGAEGDGNAADLTVTADRSITISGKNDAYYSGLYANTSGGTGNGGTMTIKTPTLMLDNEGGIQAGSLGDGNAKDIAIQVDTLSLAGGANILTQTTGRGQAGNVHLNAATSILIAGSADSGNSGIYAGTYGSESDAGAGGVISILGGTLHLADQGTISSSTTGTGNGGQIELRLDHIDLADRAAITTQSSGLQTAGDAGDIRFLNVQSLTLKDHSAVTTEAQNAGGGRINFDISNRLSLTDSRITSSVQYGALDGGDITIDPTFVTLNDSQIIANAYEGKGGNISIIADHYIQSIDSLVDASSKLGIDGRVKIESPEVDLSAGLIVLETDFIDAAQWAYTPCFARSTESLSRFVIKTKGGLRESPLGSQIGWKSSPLVVPHE